MIRNFLSSLFYLCYISIDVKSEMDSTCFGNGFVESDHFVSFYDRLINITDNNIQLVYEDRKNVYGPSLAVGIIYDCYTQDEETCSFAAAAASEYATYNGYAIKIHSLKDSKDIAFNRIQYLSESIKTWAESMHYIVYMTSELVIIDMNWRIEQLFSKYKKSHAVVIATGSDKQSISPDFFVFKNNAWTKNFVSDWRAQQVKGLATNDLIALQNFYSADKDDLDDYISFLSVNSIKPEYPSIVNLKPSNKFLYLPYDTEDVKLMRRVYQSTYEEVCRNITRHQPFEPHLGLTKSKLVSWSIAAYEPIWEYALTAFSLKSSKGENNASDCENFASKTSSLVTALDAFNFEKDESLQLDDAITVRSKTFKQLFLNIKRRRSVIESAMLAGTNTSSLVDMEWRRILKSCISIGQGYIARTRDSDKDRKTALNLLKDLLEELHAIDSKDNDTQEALVNMYVDVGMIEMKEQQYEESLSHFLAGLRIARRVANYIGENVILAPATHAAEAMEHLERHEEAVVLYETVVHLAEKYYGESSLTTAYIKVQAAMANNNFYKFKKANKLVMNALEIFNNEPIGAVAEDVYELAFSLYEKTVNKRDEVAQDL